MKSSIVLIVIAGLLWGTTGLFATFFGDAVGLDAMQRTSIRTVFAAIAMATFLFFRDKKLFRISFKNLLFCIAAGTVMYFTALAYFLSIDYSSVPVAVVLMYTSPVMVMTFSVAFMGEKLTPLKGIAVAVMLIGCVLVSGLIGDNSFSLWGFIFGLLSGVLYSTYNVITKFEMQRGINPLTASTYAFITMGIVSLFFANPVETAGVLLEKPLTLLPMAVLFGVTTCTMPYLLYTISLKKLPVGTAAALAVIEPMAATLFSVIVLHTFPSVFAWVGIVLILGAVLLLAKSEK